MNFWNQQSFLLSSDSTCTNLLLLRLQAILESRKVFMRFQIIEHFYHLWYSHYMNLIIHIPTSRCMPGKHMSECLFTSQLQSFISSCYAMCNWIPNCLIDMWVYLSAHSWDSAIFFSKLIFISILLSTLCSPEITFTLLICVFFQKHSFMKKLHKYWVVSWSLLLSWELQIYLLNRNIYQWMRGPQRRLCTQLTSFLQIVLV